MRGVLGRRNGHNHRTAITLELKVGEQRRVELRIWDGRDDQLGLLDMHVVEEFVIAGISIKVWDMTVLEVLNDVRIKINHKIRLMKGAKLRQNHRTHAIAADERQGEFFLFFSLYFMMRVLWFQETQNRAQETVDLFVVRNKVTVHANRRKRHKRHK